MSRLRVTASVEQATPLLERFAQLGHQVAIAEAARDDAIAGANAVADRIVQPLLDEQAQIREQLEPWWARAGEALRGKRKTVELGGCMIGTKALRARLDFAGGDDKAALAALQEHRWAKGYVRVTYAVDKVATTKALTEGRHAPGLAELGFAMTGGGEAFVLERVGQDGTVAKAAP